MTKNKVAKDVGGDGRRSSTPITDDAPNERRMSRGEVTSVMLFRSFFVFPFAVS